MAKRGKEGPEREWLENKTGSQHPWTALARRREQIRVGPRGSREVFKRKGGGKDKDTKPKTVTESLKEKSTQTGDQAMAATPETYPAEPANAEAVYTTGPGQAVEYNYTRQGTYADQYAEQSAEQMAPVPPVAGNGQVVTTQAGGGHPMGFPPFSGGGQPQGFGPYGGGMANNPT